MNVIICGEPADAQAMEQTVLTWASGHRPERAVSVTVFHSGSDLTERLEAGLRPDVLLLWPRQGENGTEIVRTVRRRDPDLPVAYIAGAGQPDGGGRAAGALWRIEKLPAQAEIGECLETAWRRSLQSGRDSVLIETRAQTLCLPLDSILFAEVLGHTVLIRTMDETGEYTVQKRLNDVQKQLPPDVFARCHRSYIVNMRYVRRFTKKDVYLSSGDVVPLGRTLREEFRVRFRAFCQGRGVNGEIVPFVIYTDLSRGEDGQGSDEGI